MSEHRLTFESKRKGEKGFALMVVLAFTMIFAGVVLAVSRFSNIDMNANKARMSAEEIYALSRAARLEVRDQMRDTGVQALKNALHTTPKLVTFQTLQNKAYLPSTFDGSNQLAQPMYVVLANSPVDGDPNDPQTVPAAYVVLGQPSIFLDRPEVGQKAMAMTAQRLKEIGLPVNAPTYEFNAGKGKFILSLDCNNGSTDNVASWDTGCMSKDAYTKIRTALASAAVPVTLPDPAKFSGAMVIPTWRSMELDSRVLSRYPVPENPSATNMNADLYMGERDCTGHEQITVVDASATTDSVLGIKKQDFEIEDITSGTMRKVCKVSADQAVTATSGVDKRYDIKGVSGVSGGYIIASPQTTRVVGTVIDTTTKTAISNVNVLNGKALINRKAGTAADTQAALDASTISSGGNVEIHNGTSGLALSMQTASVKVANANIVTAKDDVVVAGAMSVGNKADTGTTATFSQIQTSTANAPITTNTIALGGGGTNLTVQDAVVGKLQGRTAGSKGKIGVTGDTGGLTNPWSNPSITTPVVIGVYSGTGTVGAKEVNLVPSGSGSSTIEVGTSTVVQRIDTDVCTGNCPRNRSWLDCQDVDGLKVCKPKWEEGI